MATSTCMNCRKVDTKCKEANPRRAECSAYLSHIQETTPCSDCGQVGIRDIIAFCAIDPNNNVKMSQISYWSCKDRGVDAMKDNLKNYVARCQYCRSVHNSKRHNLSQFGEWWKEQSMEHGKCAHCGRVVTDETFAAFPFAHNTAIQKRSRHGDMYSLRKACEAGEISDEEAIQIARDEIIPVCRLLCANCHRIETNSRNKSGSTTLLAD